MNAQKQEREAALKLVRDTEAYEALKRELTDDQIIFVYRTLTESYCGLCWNTGPYCCYDSVCE